MSLCPICLLEKCACKKDNRADSFYCPEELSSKVPDDRFASPFPIPKKIPTSRFSSPNSPLPPKRLDELQRCIEEANDLLRSLGNERDENNTRQLQLRLLNLQGLPVKIMIESSNENTKIIKGRFSTAGRDFLQINSHGSYVMILYTRICSIEFNHCEKHPHPDQEFLDAEPGIRRQLIFNFGEFVARRRELVNLFFGLFLYKHLNNFKGKDIFVKTLDNNALRGVLTDTEQGRIEIVSKDGTKEADLKNVTYIEVIEE
jgi:hypothetical protein